MSDLLAVFILLLIIVLFISYFFCFKHDVQLPKVLYIPRENYKCNPLGASVICSGNAYDNNSYEWKIVDISNHQQRRDETRRMLTMTITNGCQTYVLDGLGEGDSSPSPTNSPVFWFKVRDYNIQAKLTLCEDTYVLRFF